MRERTLRAGHDVVDVSVTIDRSSGLFDVEGEELPPGNSGGNGNADSQAPGPFAFDCAVGDDGVLRCTQDDD